MVSSTNVEAVAANNVALQHYGQKVVYGHVTTSSGRRILITFDVMNVRKPLLSTSALKRRGVTIIFNHDYDRIIFRNETVNFGISRLSFLPTHQGNPASQSDGDGWRVRQMTWMRKSTSTMAPRDMRLKKLQLVIDEQSLMWIKPDSLTFLVKRKQQEHGVLLNRPQKLRVWHTTRHSFHSEIGIHSALRVADEVLPHRRVVVNKTADTLPKFQTDYMFIRTVAESKTQPCITFVETRSGLVISFMCARKGGYEDLTKEIFPQSCDHSM